MSGEVRSSHSACGTETGAGEGAKGWSPKKKAPKKKGPRRRRSPVLSCCQFNALQARAPPLPPPPPPSQLQNQPRIVPLRISAARVLPDQPKTKAITLLPSHCPQKTADSLYTLTAKVNRALTKSSPQKNAARRSGCTAKQSAWPEGRKKSGVFQGDILGRRRSRVGRAAPWSGRPLYLRRPRRHPVGARGRWWI